MASRRRRPDLPYQPAPVLEALRVARDAMLKASNGVRPFGPAYRAAHVVKDAIDAFATLLTGDPTYFHLKPHGSGFGRLMDVAEQSRPASAQDTKPGTDQSETSEG